MNTRSVNGVELAFVEQGHGMPVLLVHGFPLDHGMWNAQIDALSATFRVIAPDLRGFGRSGATDGVVTMGQFADDLAALLDALGVSEPVVVCGLSMGGYVAFQFWRKHGARLRGLILCDTRASADGPEAAAARRETADRAWREGPAPLLAGMIPRLLAPGTVADRPEVAEALGRMVLCASARGIAAASRGMAERPDFTGVLAEIPCPTLVLVGQRDILTTPEEMLGIVRAIPQAQYVEIPGAGHMAPLEKPDEVNAALLEFLQTQF